MAAPKAHKALRSNNLRSRHHLARSPDEARLVDREQPRILNAEAKVVEQSSVFPLGYAGRSRRVV